jgi:hypothetical protein
LMRFYFLTISSTWSLDAASELAWCHWPTLPPVGFGA